MNSNINSPLAALVLAVCTLFSLAGYGEYLKPEYALAVLTALSVVVSTVAEIYLKITSITPGKEDDKRASRFRRYVTALFGKKEETKEGDES